MNHVHDDRCQRIGGRCYKRPHLSSRHPHRIALECMYQSNLGLSRDEARAKANETYGVPE